MLQQNGQGIDETVSSGRVICDWVMAYGGVNVGVGGGGDDGVTLGGG